MDKLIKKFVKGHRIIRINNKDELYMLLAFIERLGKVRTTTKGKYPKYFYIKNKRLIQKFITQESQYFMYTNKIFEEGELFDNMKCMNMRLYLYKFRNEIRYYKPTIWQRIKESFKYKETKPNKQLNIY